MKLQEIAGINIHTGIPLAYELDDDFRVKDHHLLGNEEEI